MSYDLMVFKKEAAPNQRKAFMDWYEAQTEWTEEHRYDDPAITSPELKNWFMEMIQTFPALNGPFASDDEDNPRVSEYSIGKEVIYVSFAWSQAEEAYPVMTALAKKHAVGFFDVSSDDGDILFPEQGQLVSIDVRSRKKQNTKPVDEQADKPWWKFW